MSNLFELIRERVPILDYLRDETNSEFKAVGEDTYRGNPCPFCGHNDCFTVYISNGSFNCFSCNTGGDLVTFEKLYRKMRSNSEAAKAIALKMNI